MTIYDYLVIISDCNKMVQDMGIVPQDIADGCLRATENLKDLVADGDYNKYREWFKLNAESILKAGK